MSDPRKGISIYENFPPNRPSRHHELCRKCKGAWVLNKHGLCKTCKPPIKGAAGATRAKFVARNSVDMSDIKGYS